MASTKPGGSGSGSGSGGGSNVHTVSELQKAKHDEAKAKAEADAKAKAAAEAKAKAETVVVSPNLSVFLDAAAWKAACAQAPACKVVTIPLAVDPDEGVDFPAETPITRQIEYPPVTFDADCTHVVSKKGVARIMAVRNKPMTVNLQFVRGIAFKATVMGGGAAEFTAHVRLSDGHTLTYKCDGQSEEVFHGLLTVPSGAGVGAGAGSAAGAAAAAAPPTITVVTFVTTREVALWLTEWQHTK